MNQLTKPLIISTAVALLLISFERVSADSTHFTEKAETADNQSPVEAKATEFQKVLQGVESESTAKAEQPLTPAPHNISPKEGESYPIAENTPHESAEIVAIEAQPIAQPLVSELPLTENTPEAIVTAEIKPTEAIELTPIAKPEILAENQGIPATEKAAVIVAAAPTHEIVDYATIQNGRSPLGILESNRDLPTQKWYLFSSAKRGAKTPTDVVEIVSVVSEANPAHRGEEVKALLIEMGIKPENIKVVAAKGEEGQIGKIYIFKK